ncbi:RRQRL motif-containing zinc-binding protein [Amycolatopsis sp. NPDC051903]|uniref:RRQRL motif-containing zinc-binding protein n=1 Tax=Amycolatopsis sp. NPDC051903 TaxID=3363936 RepID=UPI0037B0D21D
MPRTKLHDVQLWDGTWTWCYGFRDGLPVWKWGTAPAGLVTKSQLWEQQLRRRRGQDPFGLLVFRKRGCGEQVGELFRIDLALASRRKSTRWLASIEAMRRAHRTCRRCGTEFEHYLPTSTWKCWSCMKSTGDFGAPEGVELTPAAAHLAA